MDDPLGPLVARAQRGDRVAFGELVQQTQGRVYSLAYAFLGHPQEAEDLTQEVFMRAWRALPAFRGEARFTTWLYRIAANVCLNQQRQLRGQAAHIGDEQRLEEAPAEQADPAEAVALAERNARLWQAVADLPARYRLAVALFYQQQLSYEEVATTLGLPLGTVKAQLNRARIALAATLGEEGFDAFSL